MINQQKDRMSQASNIKKQVQLTHGIKDNFMKQIEYEKVSKDAFLKNVAFRQFCQSLQKYYLNYKKAADGLFEVVKHNNNTNKTYVRDLNRFIQDFSMIMRDLSTFQIDSYTQLAKDSQDLPRYMTNVIISKIKQYGTVQNDYKHAEEKLELTRNEIKHFGTLVKKQSIIPYVYYDQNYMREKYSQFTKYEQGAKKFGSNVQNILQKVKENSYQFGKFITAYRKKLLNFKQHNLQKTVETSKVSRQCLSQLLVYLSQCVFVNYNKYFGIVLQESFRSRVNQKWDKDFSLQSVQIIKKKDADQFKLSDQGDIQKEIIGLRNQYFMTIDDLCNVFKGLIKNFKIMKQRINNKDDEQSKQELFKSLNNLYDGTENPTNHVMQTLQLFGYFNSKMFHLVNKFEMSYHALMKLRQDAKKHVDITLSILKTNLRGTDRVLVNRYSSQKMHLEKLEEQVASDHIKNIINSVFQAFKNTFTQLNNYFGQKFYRKKKMELQDSMDLSYIQESIIKIQKGPSKNERWMWQVTWKDFDTYRYSDSNVLLQNLNDFFDKMTFNTECSKFIEKYPCSLESIQKRQIKGQFQITQKQFIFISSGNNSNSNQMKVVIPLSQVTDDAEVKNKLIDDFVILHTKKGKIYFKKFNDVQQTKNAINNRLAQSGGPAQEEPVQKKLKVQLSQQELDFIAQRKKKIEPQLQKIDNQILYEEFEINNIGIDEVYEQIYSDKEISIQGKQFQNFMNYLFLKRKSTDYQAGKYDQPGPKFYTLNENVTFMNCPLYSKKQTTYKIPLPPMPFMPKFATVSQQSRVYWISHQQLDYILINNTSGAPSSDTFYVKSIYRIRQIPQKAVKIQIYGNIFFIKSAALQGIIKSKSLDEMKIGLKQTKQIIQKRLKSYIRKRDGISDEPKDPNSQVNQLNQQQLSVIQQAKPQEDQLSKLKNQNRLMIYVVIGIIMFNVLLKIFGY